MEIEEITSLIDKDEPLEIKIFQNGKFYIGTLYFYPRKLRDALYSLYKDGEMKAFSKEDEKQMLLEKLRHTPPNKEEFEVIKAGLAKNENFAGLSDEKIMEIGLDYFKKANEGVLWRRLATREVGWTFPGMMRNFDTEISNSLLRILSTAQMRAANEVRKKLQVPKLSKKEMKEFIDNPLRETENILLDTKQGGNRYTKKFVWKDENKKAFYKQVIELPKIKNKPMWEYALYELNEKNFDFYIKEYLINKTPFKNVPKKLFNEALKTWQRYKDGFDIFKPHEKPRAFEFQHAIYLLGYEEIKFSTAGKYFQEGKKLSNLDK